MSKKDKKQVYYTRDQNTLVQKLKNETLFNLRSRYYNLWLSKYKFKGFSENETLNNQMSQFFMRKLYKNGNVAAYEIPNAGELGLAAQEYQKNYNMYDFSTNSKLLNPRGLSDLLIPSKLMTVGEDVVIITCLPDGGNIESIVEYYAEKLVEVEVLTSTNMRQLKFPFMIVSDQKDQERMQNIIDNIMNDKPVIYASLEDLSRIQTLITQAPYLLDKLMQHKNAVEAELKQVLGIDNAGTSQKLLQTHVVMDAVNANNTETNCYKDMYREQIEKGLKEVEELFGFVVTIEDTVEDSLSIHEEGGNEDDSKNLPVD